MWTKYSYDYNRILVNRKCDKDLGIDIEMFKGLVAYRKQNLTRKGIESNACLPVGRFYGRMEKNRQ